MGLGEAGLTGSPRRLAKDEAGLYARLSVWAQNIPVALVGGLEMTNQNTKGGRWVFARCIRKNGRVIYPKKARFFRFWVED